jgi:SAM-dependent methyltransferase
MAGAATTWGVGEYPIMAQRLRSAARRVVARARIAPGDRVLDVACGTGNAALAAAERGASDVVGVDVEPALLDVAEARAAETRANLKGDSPRLGLTFRVGDAQDLRGAGIGDASFDAVLSVFGAMYAADHEAAARELARAAAPGGRVVLASWSPGSFLPAMGAAVAPFLPAPPPSSGPPSRWGDAAACAELLAGAGLEVVAAQAEHLVLSLPDRMNAVAFLVRTAGHVLAERPRLEAEGRWGELLAAVGGVVAERDRGVGGRVALRCDYLLVEARPPAPAS